MVQYIERRLVSAVEKHYIKLPDWLGKTVLPIAIGVIFLCCYVLLFSSLLEEVNPAPNADGKYYKLADEVNVQLPITLENVGVSAFSYRHASCITGHNLMSDQGVYMDSMVDQLGTPEQIWTVSYEIWRIPVQWLLDRKETQLQKRYGEKTAEADLDYGALHAYWIGERLLLRYEDVIVFFHAETTREAIDSSACADFMREAFTVRGYLFDT